MHSEVPWEIWSRERQRRIEDVLVRVLLRPAREPDRLDEAMRYARLARAAGFNEWVKLEVIGDSETLLPDTAGLLEATKALADDGFKVMAYTNDDLITALRLEDAGAVAVMPLAYLVSEVFEPLIRDRPKATQFPGSALAETVTQKWREKFGSPLAYVGGGEFASRARSARAAY